MMLLANFFDRDPQVVAKDLLGKVLRMRHHNLWLAARIIETEAYYLSDRASHASLGYTPKRAALFMPAGTIYMYYARGGDSLNVSCHGEGNAVLIKSGFPYLDEMSGKEALECMKKLNPSKTGTLRPIENLCSGQTLLCKSLGIKVPHWDQQIFSKDHFYIEDVRYTPEKILQTTRLGIPLGRDEHLPYRFVDAEFVKFCTKAPKNPSLIKNNIPY